MTEEYPAAPPGRIVTAAATNEESTPAEATAEKCLCVWYEPGLCIRDPCSCRLHHQPGKSDLDDAYQRISDLEAALQQSADHVQHLKINEKLATDRHDVWRNRAEAAEKALAEAKRMAGDPYLHTPTELTEDLRQAQAREAKLVEALRAVMQFAEPEVHRGPDSNGWVNSMALATEALLATTEPKR